MRSRTVRRIAPGIALAFTLPMGVALAAPTVIPNGTFEADEPGWSGSAFEEDPLGWNGTPTDTALITGWTVLNQLVDLGVTEIAGCTTVDTQDYTQLREWDLEAEPEFTLVPVPDDPDGWHFTVEFPAGTQLTVGGSPLFFDDDEGDYYIETEGGRQYDYDWSEELAAEFELLRASALPDPTERADDVTAEGFFEFGIEFSTHLVDMDVEETDLAEDLRVEDGFLFKLDVPSLESTYGVGASFYTRSGTSLLLYSNMWTDEGYDGYVVHGPAVYSDVFTIEQSPRSITLDWAALGDSDDFAVLGYLLNVDTCAQTEIIDATGESSEWTSTSVTVEEAGDYRFVFVSGTFDKSFGGAAGALFFIDDIAQTAVFSEPGIELELSAEVGATVAGAPVQVSGGGLKATSPYTLTLRSDPVVLVAGTTDEDGSFFDLVVLPDGLTPGVHTLTLVGLAPDDTELTRTTSFTVSPSGTFGSIDDGTPVTAGGGSVSIASSDIALSCAPSPAIPGGRVTCEVAGGPPSAAVLWRAIGPDGTILTTAGVDLDTAGRGTFSFAVPSRVAGATVGVELVAWLPPLQVPVAGALAPTRVSAGEGVDVLVPLQLTGLLAAGLAGVAVAGRTRRRHPA